MLKDLSDDLIVDSYYKAVDLNLEEEFILILEREISTRGLKIRSIDPIG